MSVPIIPKVITFTLQTEDDVAPVSFAEDVIGAAVVPSPGAVQSVITLDGVTHQDAEGESWALELSCVQDWDTSRPGLASYLFTNKGLKADFVLNVYGTGALSATEPATKGTVTLVPIAYGGDGNTFVETDVSLPLDGAPVVDTTP
jgi:hypothetical protein